MSKKAVYDYLDDSRRESTSDDDQALLALLQEVEELPDHDPGEPYWHHFNSRLDQRLTEVKTRAPWWRRLLPPLALALSAALLVLVLFPAETVHEPMPLAELHDESLALIAAIYLPIEEEPAVLFDEDALDVMLDVYDDEVEMFDEEEPPDAEALQNLWDQEG